MYLELYQEGGYFSVNVQILGMGHALPPETLTNKDLEKMVDTSHEWILERTGIIERRIGNPDMKTSDLCLEASIMALEHSGVAPENIDLIIVATVTPDMIFPSTACILQDKLGANHAAAFDIEAGCTGFIYALTIAEKFLSSPDYECALVVGAELLSRITDYSDRNTCVLFGDGAGATVLKKGHKDFGILNSYLGSEGKGADLLYVPAGGSASPASIQTIKDKLHFMKMNGPEIFRFASKIMVNISETLLSKSGLEYKDIDLFVPHQANMRIIQAAMRRMNIPLEKTAINLDKFGNMSAASVPVALSMAVQEGRVKDGDLVLTAAFGAGLTYGGSLIRWGSD